MKKQYICKRLRLLEFLKNKGYNPIKTIPDPTDTKYNWWIFDAEQDEFNAALNEYFERFKRAV